MQYESPTALTGYQCPAQGAVVLSNIPSSNSASLSKAFRPINTAQSFQLLDTSTSTGCSGNQPQHRQVTWGKDNAAARVVLPIPTSASVCSMQTMAWLPAFGIFDVCADVDDCSCTRGDVQTPQHSLQ